MEYVNVNGVDVPAIGFGTWKLTGEECKEIVKDTLKIGYRHIDTAQHYQNEDSVGKAINDFQINREDLFLTTKVWRSDLSYNDVIEKTKESLKKLKTNYVDLLLIHWPNEEINISETLEAMEKLVEEGKVEHIGLSNFPLNLLKEAEEKTTEKIFCDQVEYHPFISNKKLLQYCQENNIMLTAYSPLAQGKVAENELLKEIGEKYNKTPAQVSLRYLIQQDMVSAIPRAANPKHRKENYEVFDFTLTSKEMVKIGKLARGGRVVNPSFSPW